MKIVTTAAFALLLAAAGPALAATTTTNTDATPATNPALSTNSPEATNMRQQMQNDLTKAGFTNIQIMPESFLVRAKDPHGNPVMMVINPDSFTELTTISPKAGAAADNNMATGGAPATQTPAQK